MTQVTSLGQPQETTLDLGSIALFPNLLPVYQWWEGRILEGMPTSIDPQKLPPPIFPYLMLIELEGNKDACVRLAGSAACEMYGGEMKGLSVFDFFGQEDGRAVLRNLQITSFLREASLATRSYVAVNDRVISYTRLLLPLREVNGRKPMILKILEPDTLVEMPRRSVVDILSNPAAVA